MTKNMMFSEKDEREVWLRGLNSRNIEEEGEDSSKWDFAIVFVCRRVLDKFSPWEQKKFHKCDLKLCFGEDTDENWLWSEDVCHFFGVDHPQEAGDLYMRRLKSIRQHEMDMFQRYSETNWNHPEGFGVKVAVDIFDLDKIEKLETTEKIQNELRKIQEGK